MRFEIYRTGGIWPYAWQLVSPTRIVARSAKALYLDDCRRDIISVKRMLGSEKVSAAPIVVIDQEGTP